MPARLTKGGESCAREARHAHARMRSKRSPGLADEDQLAIGEIRRRQHDRTGSGARGLLTACFTLFDAFQKWKGLRVGLVGTAAHQFRALIRPAFVWIPVPAALGTTKHSPCAGLDWFQDRSHLLQQGAGDKDFQAKYQKMVPLVESGHREIFTIVDLEG